MKKLSIFIISLFLCVGAFQTRVYAKADPSIPYQEGAVTDVQPIDDDIIYKNGTIPNPLIIESPNNDTDAFGKKIPSEYFQADESYKSIYLSPLERRVTLNTKTKPRSEFAISWAEAVCEAAEIKYNVNSRNVDLSEMHLAWFAYNNSGAEDPLGLITNVGTGTTKTGTEVFNLGGNPVMATLALANGIGFIDENKFPQKDSYTNEELLEYTKSSNTYKPDYVLKLSEWYTFKTEQDKLRIKEALMSYGPLAVTVHLSDSWLKNKKPVFTDNSIYAKNDIYMTPELASDFGENTEPNYGALLVGWDDDAQADGSYGFNVDLLNTFNPNYEDMVEGKDFSFGDTYMENVYWKTNTPCTPSNNGAWIVKVNIKDDETLYYYYSYEDASISNSVAASFVIEEAKNAIHTYQLDGNSGMNYYDAQDNEALFYNVYEPQNKEQIDSVGLFTYQPNISYEINVYRDVPDNLASLDEIQDSKFACMKKFGTFVNPGFHKLDLVGTPYSDDFYNALDYNAYQNQKLLVIVKYMAPEGTNVLVPVDGITGTYGDINMTGTTTGGNSFLVVNGEDKDLVSLAGGPAKIKLYTCPVSNKIIYNVPSGVSVPSDARLFYTDDDEIDLLVDAIKEGYEFYNWYSDENELILNNCVTSTPRRVTGDLNLYPAFKQRIIFDYNDENEDIKEFEYYETDEYTVDAENKRIIVNVDKYDDDGKAGLVVMPSNKTKNGTKEFMGWGIVDEEGDWIEGVDSEGNPIVTIDNYCYSYKFEDGKLNGDDIVCKPIWKTIVSENKKITQADWDGLGEGEVKYVSAGEATSVIAIPSDKLEEATQGVVKEKAILWFTANEISKTEDTESKDNEKYDGYKDNFETQLNKILDSVTVTVTKLIDIDVFAQKAGDTSGEKVPELSKKVPIEYDLSGEENKELREAAEKGILHISQMHNGSEVIDIQPEDITYNKDTMKITFMVRQFSVFAFSVGKPKSAETPSGEGADPTSGDKTSEDTTGGSKSGSESTDSSKASGETSGDNTSKTTDNKSTSTNTPDPNFKTPNTGIY